MREFRQYVAAQAHIYEYYVDGMLYYIRTIQIDL